jgi:hypothetical protein
MSRNKEYYRVRVWTRNTDGTYSAAHPAHRLTNHEADLLGSLSASIFGHRIWCDTGREVVAGKLLLVERL